jgi:hypothetical protein
MFSWSKDMMEREMERFSVIKPPSNMPVKKRTMRVLIDSRDRNHLNYPLPSHYRYDFLQDTPQHVENIELLSANIPMPQYKIHSNNNNLNFSTSLPLWDPSANEYIFSDIYNLKVPVGDYTEGHLANVLKIEFQKYVEGIEVRFDPVQGHFHFDISDTTVQPFPILSFLARGKDTMYGANETIESPLRDETGEIMYDGKGQMRTQLVTENNIQANYLKGTILKPLGFGLKQHSTMLPNDFLTHVLDNGFGKSIITYISKLRNDGDPLDILVRSGDKIHIYDYENPRQPDLINNMMYVVETIDTSQVASTGFVFVTLNQTIPHTSSSLRIAKTNLESDFKSAIAEEPYIVLRIERGGNVISNNKAIHKSFAIVNKMFKSYTNLHVYDLMYGKKFSPLISQLSSITFKFLNQDGTLYDFQNQDHYLEVLITMNSQNTKYSI